MIFEPTVVAIKHVSVDRQRWKTRHDRGRETPVTASYFSWSGGQLEGRLLTASLSLAVFTSASAGFGDAPVVSGEIMLGTQHLLSGIYSYLNRLRTYTIQSLMSLERLSNSAKFTLVWIALSLENDCNISATKDLAQECIKD